MIGLLSFYLFRHRCTVLFVSKVTPIVAGFNKTITFHIFNIVWYIPDKPLKSFGNIYILYIYVRAFLNNKHF